MSSRIASHGRPPARVRKEFIEGIIDFVFSHLALWRDELSRQKTEGEEELNAQLCRYLTEFANKEERLFTFFHEARQGQRRRVDIATFELPSFEGRLYTNDRNENLTVFEAKRLPAPEMHRMREYLTGEPGLSGGVQRFKASVHGQAHTISAMIGYIQQHDATHFYNEINGWIENLSTNPVDSLLWSTSEKLTALTVFDNGTARSVSLHPRQGIKEIVLHHLWVTMNQ